jgi:hypothetical protein
MRLHELVDRVTHPERHPEGSRSGLQGAVAANLERTRRRNANLAAAFTEGYEREHADDPDPPRPERADALGAASLAKLFARQPNREEPPP